MKNKKIFSLLISIIIMFSAVIVFADTTVEYTPLEPDAFSTIGVENTGDLGTFLGAIFKFGIAIAVVLAFIMIVYAGIIKMTTDSWSKTETANETIKNALYGLGLALVSYLILYTINPCIVEWTGTTGCKANTFLNPQAATDASVMTTMKNYIKDTIKSTETQTTKKIPTK